MRIFEVDNGASNNQMPDAIKLLGLVEFLSGRAEDTSSRKEISQDAFINAAQSLGITVTKQNLPELTNMPPLSGVLEPLQPDSNDPIVYRGGEPANVAMPVNQAQDIVGRAAKSAMKRGMK